MPPDLGLGNRGLVDLHAVGAVQVVDHPAIAFEAHGGVTPGDRVVREDDFVVGAAAEADLRPHQRHDLVFTFDAEPELELLGQ